MKPRRINGNMVPGSLSPQINGYYWLVKVSRFVEGALLHYLTSIILKRALFLSEIRYQIQSRSISKAARGTTLNIAQETFHMPVHW